MAAHHLDNEIQKYILNCILNLNESQCNDFNRRIERLKLGAFVTTLAKQFWTRKLCRSLARISCNKELQ